MCLRYRLIFVQSDGQEFDSNVPQLLIDFDIIIYSQDDRNLTVMCLYQEFEGNVPVLQIDLGIIISQDGQEFDSNVPVLGI